MLRSSRIIAGGCALPTASRSTTYKCNITMMNVVQFSVLFCQQRELQGTVRVDQFSAAILFLPVIPPILLKEDFLPVTVSMFNSLAIPDHPTTTLTAIDGPCRGWHIIIYSCVLQFRSI